MTPRRQRDRPDVQPTRPAPSCPGRARPADVPARGRTRSSSSPTAPPTAPTSTSMAATPPSRWSRYRNRTPDRRRRETGASRWRRRAHPVRRRRRRVAPDLIEQHVRSHDGDGDGLVVIGPMLTPPDFPQPVGPVGATMLYRQYDAMSAGDCEPTFRQFYTATPPCPARPSRRRRFRHPVPRAEDVELSYRLDAGRAVAFASNPKAIGFHYADRTYDCVAAHRLRLRRQRGHLRSATTIVPKCSQPWARRVHWNATRMIRLTSHVAVGPTRLTRPSCKTGGAKTSEQGGVTASDSTRC